MTLSPSNSSVARTNPIAAKGMTVQMTCCRCGSSIQVYPGLEAKIAKCDICGQKHPVNFSKEHELGQLKECPVCQKKKFYSQKDFNRKLGVIFFAIAAIFSIWTYGISLIVLFLLDSLLFRLLGNIVVCYECGTIFRSVKNIGEMRPFDHETNDRIVYSGQSQQWPIETVNEEKIN